MTGCLTRRVLGRTLAIGWRAHWMESPMKTQIAAYTGEAFWVAALISGVVVLLGTFASFW